MTLDDDATTAEIWHAGDGTFQWRATLHEPRIVARGGASSHDEAAAQVALACRALGGDAGEFSEHDAREYVAGQAWVFARTMPENPHEYVVLARSTRPHLHLAFRQLIRDRGVLRTFGGWEFSYLDIDDHRYWVSPTDPAPDGQSWTIINRKTIGAPQDR